MYNERFIGRRGYGTDKDAVNRMAKRYEPGSSGVSLCDTGDKECEIGSGSMPALAMVYVPYQNFCSLYTEEKGFMRGTIFVQLDKPFTPHESSGRRGGSFNGCKM